MEQKINIAEILKNCPRRTKLYSPIFGEGWVSEVGDYLIKVYDSNGNDYNFYYDGTYVKIGECMLFPSKENRDWSKFQRPFKDGDILFIQAAYSWILIYKDSENKEDIYKYAAISGQHNHKFIVYDNNPLCCKEDISNIRFATDEEKEKLFDAIKANGYKWNAETKTLEELIEPKFKVGDRIKLNNSRLIFTITDLLKDRYRTTVYSHDLYEIEFERQDAYELVPDKFDITTLTPFESRVLVREDKKDVWQPAFYGFFNQHNKRFYTTSTTWRMCIPYNEDTKHLTGTTNDCDGYYKIWE